MWKAGPGAHWGTMWPAPWNTGRQDSNERSGQHGTKSNHAGIYLDCQKSDVSKLLVETGDLVLMNPYLVLCSHLRRRLYVSSGQKKQTKTLHPMKSRYLQAQIFHKPLVSQEVARHIGVSIVDEHSEAQREQLQIHVLHWWIQGGVLRSNILTVETNRSRGQWSTHSWASHRREQCSNTALTNTNVGTRTYIQAPLRINPNYYRYPVVFLLAQPLKASIYSVKSRFNHSILTNYRR